MGAGLSFLLDMSKKHIDLIGTDKIKFYAKILCISLLFLRGVTWLHWSYRFSQNLKKGRLARQQRDQKYSLNDKQFETTLPTAILGLDVT
jgi:hypothetical protein